MPSTWTPTERQAWESIRQGLPVNLAIQYDPSKEALPKWKRDRKYRLSASFLSTVLLDPQFTKLIPRSGVVFSGAWIPETIEIGYSSVPFSVIFYECVFDNEFVILNTTFEHEFELRSIVVGGSFNLGNDDFKISFWITNSQFKPILAISSRFYNLWITGIQCDRLTFSGCQVANGTQVRDIKGPVEFAAGKLANASVSGSYPSSVSFNGIICDGELDISQANFASAVDIQSTQINGSFWLATSLQSCQWNKGSSLNLTDTQVQILRDAKGAWPETLYLNGFLYKTWRPETSEPQEISQRDVKTWFSPWLRRQKEYSPEPYNQLAALLRDTGQSEKATEVPFTSKEREREETLTGFRWLFSTLSLTLIGHGYHYEYSLYWCIAFVLLGMLILQKAPEGKTCRSQNPDFNGLDMFFYSLDAFLPFVQLRHRFGDIDFKSWIRYYFYFHRLVGYVIGFFIIAGLGGITK